MLIPESRRTWEAASRISPEPDSGSAVDGRDSDPTPTVLRTSGSSARRQPALAPTPTPLPSTGEAVGTFLLEEAIGAGGMGAVFRALDTQLDRQVALKLLPPDQAADPEVVQRFYQEGRSAAQLDHENIARVYSIGHDGAFHHIAFEYIEGVTLRQRVESTGPLKPSEAVDVALQIANALVHASRRGVVHRDIKPSNIILTPQGRAKLVDMGLARRFERGGDHGLTQTGMTLGTFDYISPEQARDPRDVDVRSDLYSLGCTLFHMLTGRPPFPGGTVLQKLIQHQEEPPADVRTLNPEVPDGLSSIISKLMAKDRDRRYQGPEHLVRDLLALAGSLGLESSRTQVEPWMLHGHHGWWERHLAWVLPAVGFVVLISGLAWWGREFSRPPIPGRNPGADPTQRANPDARLAESTGPEIRTVSPETPVAEAEPSAYPQTIPVSSTEDLYSVLASAPRRSVIVLADDGPYRLGGRGWSPRGASRPSADADLTIKAETGVRPVLMRDDSSVSEDGRAPSLLHFLGGHVVIEGVEFDLGQTVAASTSAIRCDDTELVLRGCSFRRTNREGDARDVAAILVRTAGAGLRGAERPPAVFADYCHFDGGQAAFRAQGPADITLRDCTLGPAGPSLWFERGRSELAVPAEIRLIHTSVLARSGPVFRIEGGPVRVRVDDCVIGAAGRSPATLVQIDDPRNLNWRGRTNLYGSIGPFLTTLPKASQPAKIADYEGWEQSAPEPRELSSRASAAPIWDASDPMLALAQERDNPTRVFLLDPGIELASDVGARHGPFNAILKNVRMTQQSSSPRQADLSMARVEKMPRSDPRPSPTDESPARPDPGRDRTPLAKEGTVASDDQTSATPATDPMTLPSMPPMSTSGATQPEMEPEDEAASPPVSMPETVRAETARGATPPAPPSPSAPSPASPASPVSDEDVIRSPEQFLAVLRHLDDRGGTLNIAAGVDLELPTASVALGAGNRLQIQGAPGGTRPRLRFRPAPTPGASPTDSAALLNLRSGSLQLKGLDLIVPEPETMPADRLAAIAVLPATELILEDCTITVAFRSATASAFAVQPRSIAPGRTPAGEREDDTIIRVRNGFVRSGGDGVLVAGGGRLSLQLENVMVATEGSLLHALGAGRGANTAGPAGRSPLGVRLDRVCARVKGGLVHLQTTHDEPEMAAVDIRADNSILSTVSGDRPLFRLEGQERIERLREKIRWVGHKNAYHHIKTYLRDEIVQAGGLPRIYDRDDWTRAFEPTDDSPMLADLRFHQQLDSIVPAWKVSLDDLSLAASSTAGPLGPEVGKVPEPPASDEGP